MKDMELDIRHFVEVARVSGTGSDQYYGTSGLADKLKEKYRITDKTVITRKDIVQKKRVMNDDGTWTEVPMEQY